VRAGRFFGAHHRVELDAAGQERLVGFNFSEEPTGALVNFFEYEPAGFRLLSKATHQLEVPPAAALPRRTRTGTGPRLACAPKCCLRWILHKCSVTPGEPPTNCVTHGRLRVVWIICVGPRMQWILSV